MKVEFLPGKPIILRSLLEGPSGAFEVRLLLDTGATFTMLSHAVLFLSGHDPTRSDRRVSLTTASGTAYAPQVSVNSLSTLGIRREDFVVAAHTLPPSAPVDGLLGLDFLVGLRLTLDMRLGELAVDA